MNIIITGAGKGIGYSIVKKLLIDPKNRIYAISRNIHKLEILAEMNQNRIIPVQYDIISLKYNSHLPLPLSDLKDIDILINNAGFLINKSFTEMQLPEIEKIMDVNFTAPFLLIQKLMQNFNPQKAHVVNIGSMGGYQGSEKFPGLSVYSSSKAALSTLTECLATECKEKNISFNCLAIGSVQTEMLEQAFPGYKAPVSADNIADFIVNFAVNGHKFMNGKIIPVALVNP